MHNSHNIIYIYIYTECIIRIQTTSTILNVFNIIIIIGITIVYNIIIYRNEHLLYYHNSITPYTIMTF